MAFDTTLRALKAAADPTRLRLLALLAAGEATVGELQEILEQSQPRVSRHLRLLDEAGLVTRFRDAHWVYYRLAESPAALKLTSQVIDMAGAEDATISADRAALTRVKRGRERDAHGSVASRPRRGITEKPSDATLVEALEECVGERLFDDVLVAGCGDGRLLCLLGMRAHSVVGVDDSKRARLVARSRLHETGLANCTVRQARLPDLEVEAADFDLVILNGVLGATDQPESMLLAARRALRRRGRLVILDRVRPAARKLPGRAAEGLFENQLTAMLSGLGFGVGTRTWFPGRVMEYALISATPRVAPPRTGTDD